jgi:hypothetical protein
MYQQSLLWQCRNNLESLRKEMLSSSLETCEPEPSGWTSSILRCLCTNVTSFGNGTCNAAIASGSAVSANFYDPFLRNGYFIFDQEDFTVTMGQAEHTAKRDIVSYPSGGFKVAANA